MEAKHIKDIQEAYASVYGQQQEVLSEDLQQNVGKALDAAAKNPIIKAIGSVIAPVGKGRGTVTKQEQDSTIKKNLNQDVDLFDLVKGHLIDEGYAETEEAALAIMANMSEQWKQSIVEGVAERTVKAVENQRQGYLGDDDALNKLQDAASKSMGRLKKGQGPVVTPGGLPGV